MKMMKILYASILLFCLSAKNSFAYKFRLENKTKKAFKVDFDLAVCKDSDYRGRNLKPKEDYTWKIGPDKKTACIKLPAGTSCRKCSYWPYAKICNCKTKWKKKCTTISLSRAGCCLHKLTVRGDGKTASRVLSACHNTHHAVVISGGKLKLLSQKGLEALMRKKREAGVMLVEGGKMLKKAVPEMDTQLIPLYAMPGQLEEGKNDIKKSIDDIGSALADVRKQKTDIKKQRSQLEAFGLNKFADDVESGLASLETALIALADVDKAGTCTKGILCDYLTASDESQQVAAADIKKIKQQVKKLKDRLSKKYVCWAHNQNMPDHMIRTGNDLKK